MEVGAALRDGGDSGAAWKLNSRSGSGVLGVVFGTVLGVVLGSVLGNVGDDGEVGTLNVGMDEGAGKDEGGGNSLKIRGSGRFC